jgi:hypothetical protein
MEQQITSMVPLTPHDSAVLTQLVQFSRLSLEKRKEILEQLKSEDARKVGEVVLDRHKYATSPADVRATVDRFDQWLEANRRLGRQRSIRRRTARVR